jgi:hypothetical protein
MLALRVTTLGSFFLFVYLFSCFIVFYIEIRLSVLLLYFSSVSLESGGYTRMSVYSTVYSVHVVCLLGYDCLPLCCTHWASLDMSVCLSIISILVCIFYVSLSY